MTTAATTPIPDFRLSGGELPPSERDAYHNMRKNLLNKPDVHALLGLAYEADSDSWIYWIMTPFATWPRYVIGITDPDLLEIDVVFRGNTEVLAIDEWRKLAAFRGLTA